MKHHRGHDLTDDAVVLEPAHKQTVFAEFLGTFSLEQMAVSRRVRDEIRGIFEVYAAERRHPVPL